MLFSTELMGVPLDKSCYVWSIDFAEVIFNFDETCKFSNVSVLLSAGNAELILFLLLFY
jgi:hypothetical protein